MFLVGHDWGAVIAWHVCLLRPDRIKALVNMSVVFHPRNPKRKPIESMRAVLGDDYYICRFQVSSSILLSFVFLLSTVTLFSISSINFSLDKGGDVKLTGDSK